MLNFISIWRQYEGKAVDDLKCDVCKNPLTLKTIGYVRAVHGRREYECRRCHSMKRGPKTKKLSGSWLLIT